ncbi:MAG: FAD-dependent oxidoreductase [Candidatus Nanoarchaeia archaeon]
MSKTYETIIIGGGIAGLACARRLHEAKRDFLLITEDVGGRIKTSKDGKVNYGAFFVTDEYKHLLPWVIKGRRIRIRDLLWHKGGRPYHIMALEAIPYMAQYIRLYVQLIKFKQHYRTFKKRCESMSQEEGLDLDPYLKGLYKKRTAKLLHELKINEIVDKYVHEMLYAMSFVSDKQSSAFAFLQWTSQLLSSGIYEFKFKKDKLVNPIKNKIKKGSVVRIGNKRTSYVVTTRSGKTIAARNVVVATPPLVTKKLLHLKRVNRPLSAYMKHVRGMVHKAYADGREELFNPHSKMCVISKQTDGTYLVYSKSKEVNLRQYFARHKILSEVYWSPAFVYPSSFILDQNPKPNLYVAGDPNVGGMEDAYITGLYAANQIIKTWCTTKS